MMAEVHRLTNAGPIVEPVAEIIEELEKLLAEARAGEIKGFAYFLVDGADCVGTNWVSGCARCNDMVAGVARLHHTILGAALE
jgi:hypothetical protein